MIFVTGGTGFIGSYLLYYLTFSTEKIVAIRRASSSMEQVKNVFRFLDELGEGNQQQKLENIEWRQADILDAAELEEAMQGAEQVYHVAALVSFNRRRKDAIIETNVNGTANVVDAAMANNVKKLGYVSSIGALYKRPGQMLDEESHIENFIFPSRYSESKYFGEMEAWRGAAEGLPCAIVNPGVVLAPGDFSHGPPKLFSSVANGLKFYTPGATGFVDARDVARALIGLMNSEIKNERYVLVSENWKFLDLFNSIAECLNVPAPRIKANRLMSELVWRAESIRSLLTGSEPFITRELAQAAQLSYFFKNEKIKNALNFDFIPLKKTIEDTCRIYLNEQEL
ncbi:MAG: NAD-dependent epimerase/dehydratase family protein [Bacteroidia bacterium]